MTGSYTFDDWQSIFYDQICNQKISFTDIHDAFTGMGIPADIRETFMLYYMCDSDPQNKVDVEEFTKIVADKIFN